MRKRIFKSIVGVTIFSIVTLNLLITLIFLNIFSNEQTKNLELECQIFKSAISDNSNYNSISALHQTSSRVSIINISGDVLFDNKTKIFENHADRPEIISAFETGRGSSKRFSQTLSETTYYYALKLDDSTVIRVSNTSNNVFSSIFDTIPYVIGIIFVFIIIALYLSNKLTKKIVAPITLENAYMYDELLPFISKIEKQQTYIERQKLNHNQKVEEFSTITENIADGLVVLNTKSQIISINNKAKNILGKKNIDYIYKDIISLNRTEQLKSSINTAFSGQNAEFVLELSSKIFSVLVSPITFNSEVCGVVILIMDNTKKFESEKLRREFSANVSHELKTPLTSISGYSELLKSGMVQEKDIVRFAENIYDESANLINLIENIIKVSRLDEAQNSFEFSDVNLKDVIISITNRLQNKANIQNISIKLDLEDIVYNCSDHVINEIFYNLIDNSIKYNIKDGFVDISCEKLENNIQISIKDTGIGINENAISRIFERFYREDLSHSSEISGTGLGLAIVKHGVNLHGGTISVSSKKNKGSEFLITLPL